MNTQRWLPGTALALAVVYVLALGWAMQRTAYDTWGAMVIGPVLFAVSVPMLRRVFRDEPRLLRLALIGLAAKFAGSMARYWVAFDAYGGASDSGRYHENGSVLAAQIRGGDVSLLQVIPTGVGTAFVDHFTGTVYTLFGSSRLAGFLVFGWLAYWGAILYVRAVRIAVPGVALHRYTALVMLLPSLVFWPSSIGKEAWMMLTLGLGTYGGACLYAGRPMLRSLFITAAGLGGAALVRPHVAGMWLAGLTCGLVVMVLGRRTRGAADRSRAGSLVLLGIAAIALAFVAGFALRYLEPPDESTAQTSAVTRVFDETTRRSEQGGSGFETLDVSSPRSWPFAIVRTLTRPLIHEAGSLTLLLPAAEMTALLGLGVISWRRLANTWTSLRRVPYVAFVVPTSMMFGLAYTAIGNLGILTRQRSLLLPVLVVLWCLPPIHSARRRADDASAGAAAVAASASV